MVSSAAHHRRGGGGSGPRPSGVSGLHYSSAARVNTGKIPRVAPSSKSNSKSPESQIAAFGTSGEDSPSPFHSADDEQQSYTVSWASWKRKFRHLSFRKISALLILAFVLFGSAWFVHKEAVLDATSRPAQRPLYPTEDNIYGLDDYFPPFPELPGFPYVSEQPTVVDEIRWLRDNTYLRPYSFSSRQIKALLATRPKATLLSLVRNSELDDMISSISQVEARFNSAPFHRYDWLFYNNEPFTEEFKAAVTNASSGRVFFEQIPKHHWTTPEWVDESRFGVGREFMGSIGVGKSWLESYHHMCRWNSGLFAREERLQKYDYYWRVEPGVQFTCNINYDVFRFMRDNDKSYGFNMAILDDARSFPSLWERTQRFKKLHSDMIDEHADMNWLLHTPEELSSTRLPTGLESPPNIQEYNNCQFYSNFEIGSLNFFRGLEHQSYFNHLDQAGGFYYERYGDAPVHTLSVSMFLPKSSIWFFRDIGYAHGLCQQCPPHDGVPADYHKEKLMLARDIKRQSGIPGLECGCTTTKLDENFSKLVPFESKQRKPFVSCIRSWLAGLYILPKETRLPLADIIAAGGDGYGGWRIEGIESNPFKEAAYWSENAD